MQEGFAASAVAADLIDIATFDVAGNIINVNQKLAVTLGYTSPEDIIGRPFLEFCVSPRQINRVVQDIYHAGSWVGEIGLKTINGAPLFVELIARLIRNREGKAVCVQLSLVALLRREERQKIGQALRQNIRFTANLVNHAPHPILVLNPDTSIRSVNRAFEDITGYSAQELIGVKSPYPWLTDDSLPRSQQDFQVMMNCRRAFFEERYRRKNGELFWVRVSSIPVRHEGDLEYCITMWVDITENKKIEQELRDEIERAESYLSVVGVIIASLDADGRINMINQPAEEILGYRVEELQGKKWVNSLVVPADRKEVSNALRRLVTGEMDMVKRWEHHLLTRAGNQLLFSFNYVPIRDESDAIVGVLVSGADITEVKKIRERLQHSQLLVSLGEMTSRIAHEVNNPLGSILLYSELLLAGETPAPLKKDLKIIHDEAKRAVNLLSNLLNYGRRKKPQLRRVKLNSLIEKVVSVCKSQAYFKHVSISVNAALPVFVIGDATQLVQALMNIMLHCEENLRDTLHARISINAQLEKPWAKITIEHNGASLPETHLKQVFLPALSAASLDDAPELHLSVSYGIITEHKGILRVENAANGGSIFTIELPAAATRQTTTGTPGKRDKGGVN